MIEISIIFAFLAFLCWGIEDFLAQKSARRVGDMESLAFIVIIGSILFFPFALREINSLFNLPNLALFFGIALIHFVAGLFYFESLKEGKLAIIDIVFEFELPLTVVLGIFLFKEILSQTQIFLIILSLIGIIIMAVKSSKNFTFKLEKGVVFALLTAVLMAFVNFLSAYSSRQVSPILSLWTVWVFMSFFCLIYLFIKHREFKFFKDGMKSKLLMISLAITATLAWLFYFFAVLEQDIAIIIAITEGYPIISIFLGKLINKEKINVHQYIGISLTLLASIALVFTI